MSEVIVYWDDERGTVSRFLGIELIQFKPILDTLTRVPQGRLLIVNPDKFRAILADGTEYKAARAVAE